MIKWGVQKKIYGGSTPLNFRGSICGSFMVGMPPTKSESTKLESQATDEKIPGKKFRRCLKSQIFDFARLASHVTTCTEL